VPVDAFGRAIDPRSIRRIDQQRLASARYTLDPLTYTPLRNAVINSAWGRGKINLPPGIAKKLGETPVYVSSDIRESRFRRDLTKSMHVERVSDQARNQQFKVKDEREDSRQADTGRKQEADNGRKPEADNGRKQDLGRVSAEAGKENKDNKDAARQTRQVEQQQKKDTRVQAQATRPQQRTQQATQRATQQRTQQPAQQRTQQPAQQRAQQRAQQPAQQKAQRKTEQKPQAQRVANPAKPANSEVKQPSKAAPKQERKPKPPAQPAAQGQGDGKGKAKKP